MPLLRQSPSYPALAPAPAPPTATRSKYCARYLAPGRALVAGVLLAAVAAGCGDDGQRPEQEFAGTYDLASVDERSLPHVYWCSRVGACLQVNAGRLEVMSRGRVREILAIGNAGSTVPLSVDTIISTYQLEGTRLVLTRSRSYGSVYEYADTATVRSDRLSFKPQYIGVNHGGGGTFFYVKQ